MKSVPKVSVCVVLENQISQIGLLGDFEKMRFVRSDGRKNTVEWPKVVVR